MPGSGEIGGDFATRVTSEIEGCSRCWRFLRKLSRLRSEHANTKT